MKKLIMATAVVAVAASMASAQVLSDNIVGYTKIVCPAGQLVLAGINFDTNGGTVQSVMGTQLANNSKVIVWDKASNTYITCNKGFASWTNGSTPLSNGTAFWVLASQARTIVIPGEVLTADNSVALSGLDMTSYFYPVDTTIGATDLAAQLGSGSKIIVWNGAAYVTYTKGFAGWGAGAAAPIAAAQGFWVSPKLPITWTETVPFTP